MRRALLIGINYKGTQNELQGCINDTKNIRQFLLTKNYNPLNITTLNEKNASKANILKKFNELKTVSKPNDHIFIHYSGHGSWLRDKNNDEHDKRDETLVPYDYMTNGEITDDYIYNEFLHKLTKDVNVFMLVDCCHSGTICDLRYNEFNDSNKIETSNEKSNSLFSDTECNVIMISGCKDEQTSADAYINKVFQGALTYSFLKMNEKGYTTYKLLLDGMREWLKNNKYIQYPQISSGKKIDVNHEINY
jgi:hypothetical protein